MTEQSSEHENNIHTSKLIAIRYKNESQNDPLLLLLIIILIIILIVIIKIEGSNPFAQRTRVRMTRTSCGGLVDAVLFLPDVAEQTTLDI